MMRKTKNNIVMKWNYGNYSSDNYGSHTQGFTDNYNNDYYFSYETLIAFRSNKTGLVVMENYWGTTTGKHLNWINRDHSTRVDGDTFEKLLATV
jgi:hypothetical protein